MTALRQMKLTLGFLEEETTDDKGSQHEYYDSRHMTARGYWE